MALHGMCVNYQRSMLALFLAFAIQVECLSENIRSVNTFIGTAAFRSFNDTSDDRMLGQTVPEVGLPFGMTFWTPQTRTSTAKAVSPYYWADQYFSGIRGSHWISGSAMIDYGSMTVMPLALRSAGSVCLSTNATIFQQPLHHDKEQEFGRPHYYRIKLPESGIVAEASASLRSGVLRFTFEQPPHSWGSCPLDATEHPTKKVSAGGDAIPFLVFSPNSEMGEATVSISRSEDQDGVDTLELTISVPVRRIYAGWGQLAGFSGHFTARVQPPAGWKFGAYGVLPDTNKEIFSSPPAASAPVTITGDGAAVAAYISFERASAATDNVSAPVIVVAHVGTSFTSVDEARSNLFVEMRQDKGLEKGSLQRQRCIEQMSAKLSSFAGAHVCGPRLQSFDAIVSAAENTWSESLERIQVLPDSPQAFGNISYRAPSYFDERRGVLFSSLWRSLLLPRVFSDASGAFPPFAGYSLSDDDNFSGAAHRPRTRYPPAKFTNLTRKHSSTRPAAKKSPESGARLGRRGLFFDDVSSASGRVICTTGGIWTYYDDFSMWDVFRAQLPLLHLVAPQIMPDLVRSLLEKARHAGDCGQYYGTVAEQQFYSVNVDVDRHGESWLPIFPAWNSYTSEMIGDHSIVAILDAVVKNISGLDAEEPLRGAYRIMRRNAFDPPPPGGAEELDGRGRRALGSYLSKGYIPLEEHIAVDCHPNQQVSRSLEYAYDDAKLAALATRLGLTADARVLQARGAAWRSHYHPSLLFPHGRLADGSWALFDPARPPPEGHNETLLDPSLAYDWLTEGTPWQWRWAPMHDIPGLLNLLGGERSFSQQLRLFFDSGNYNSGNEPDQHAPFLFPYARSPADTQRIVRGLLFSEYGAAADGLPGNDDAGQMGAWFVWAALGCYPVNHATGQYVLGAPLFPRMEVRLGKKPFVVIAAGVSDINYFVQDVFWEGEPYRRAYITHDMVRIGGVLLFTMGPLPSSWGTDFKDEDLPL